MKLGKLGVWYASDKLKPAEMAAFVQQVEGLGFGSYWYPESRYYESIAAGAWLLANSKTITVGSSIANIYARDAFTAAAARRSLNDMYGGRYVSGLGVSHIPMVEGMRKHDYGRPVTTMRAYLDDMAAARQPDEGDWPVAIAALGPRMLDLAAEKCDAALPYNVTPEHTARAKQAMGSAKALVVEQKFCLESDPAKARAIARAELKRYMALPNYANNWLRLGFTQDDITGEGSDRFMDAMVVWGDEAAIHARMQEHFDAGATTVVMQPLHAEGDTATRTRGLEAVARYGA
ncbi:MAG: TIGR03620 family F420-dependent LLM class oxidoreductase [Alphaproteobacteria bacterium]|nr:TIGR03620 family F420-dependent LLM class oxidoreductase [Alphaproteobacteria bacterium]MCB9928110.1 TIGR03620 family F420-dependent LLM class oxidoreductase [Alphaproteobacteria bacterium]